MAARSAAFRRAKRALAAGARGTRAKRPWPGGSAAGRKHGQEANAGEDGESRTRNDRTQSETAPPSGGRHTTEEGMKGKTAARSAGGGGGHGGRAARGAPRKTRRERSEHPRQAKKAGTARSAASRTAEPPQPERASVYHNPAGRRASAEAPRPPNQRSRPQGSAAGAAEAIYPECPTLWECDALVL